MYCATANFVSQETETLLRLDTKLWFSPPLDPLSGICVGAVVGLNPGSSSPRAGEVGDAEVDSTMSKILAAFADAYAELGRALPGNSYVRMWNLCYVREADSRRLLSSLQDPKKLSALTSCSCLDKTESDHVPCLWFAWTASTPRALAIRSRRWWEHPKCPIAYLGPDGLPHVFNGESDLHAVRHPSRKSRQALATTVKFLLTQQ